MKPSNFSAARAHLERALDHLSGSDETSMEARIAIDLLIEAAALEEYKRIAADVIPYRASGGPRTAASLLKKGMFPVVSGGLNPSSTPSTTVTTGRKGAHMDPSTSRSLVGRPD